MAGTTRDALVEPWKVRGAAGELELLLVDAPGRLPNAQHLDALGQRMLPAFAVALGMPENYFASMFADDPHATLRMLHYPPTSGADNAFGQGPHTDNSFLTILARMEIPGLRVELPSGDWVEPPLIPGTFLINLGNMMRQIGRASCRERV